MASSPFAVRVFERDPSAADGSMRSTISCLDARSAAAVWEWKALSICSRVLPLAVSQIPHRSGSGKTPEHYNKVAVQCDLLRLGRDEPHPKAGKHRKGSEEDEGTVAGILHQGGRDESDCGSGGDPNRTGLTH